MGRRHQLPADGIGQRRPRTRPITCCGRASRWGLGLTDGCRQTLLQRQVGPSRIEVGQRVVQMIGRELLQPFGIYLAALEFQRGPCPLSLIDEGLQDQTPCLGVPHFMGRSRG